MMCRTSLIVVESQLKIGRVSIVFYLQTSSMVPMKHGGNDGAKKIKKTDNLCLLCLDLGKKHYFC